MPACPTPYPTAGGDFTTTTGLEHLLETNACPRVHTDRDSTYRFVRSKDPQGLIAKKLLDCEVSHRHEATERAWNGYAFEFYLRTREFGCLHGLNQHLNSGAREFLDPCMNRTRGNITDAKGWGVDEEKLYRCPNRNCREFKTLAAILNHLESESCGITRFQTVQNSVDRMMRGGNLLTI